MELDASKRALAQLKQLSLVDEEEQNSSKQMLQAAALTYVAALASTILNLLRLIIILDHRNN